MIIILDLPRTAEELLVWKLEYTGSKYDLKTMSYNKHHAESGVEIYHAYVKWIAMLYKQWPEIILIREMGHSDSVCVSVHGISVGSFEALDILDAVLHKDTAFTRVFGRLPKDG
jgi:hypothetical protein